MHAAALASPAPALPLSCAVALASVAAAPALRRATVPASPTALPLWHAAAQGVPEPAPISTAAELWAAEVSMAVELDPTAAELASTAAEPALSRVGEVQLWLQRPEPL